MWLETWHHRGWCGREADKAWEACLYGLCVCIVLETDNIHIPISNPSPLLETIWETGRKEEINIMCLACCPPHPGLKWRQQKAWAPSQGRYVYQKESTVSSSVWRTWKEGRRRKIWKEKEMECEVGGYHVCFCKKLFSSIYQEGRRRAKRASEKGRQWHFLSLCLTSGRRKTWQKQKHLF